MIRTLLEEGIAIASEQLGKCYNIKSQMILASAWF